MQVAPQQSPADETPHFGQVLQFPQARVVRASWPLQAARPAGGKLDLDDHLARFEQRQDEPIDYRQRTLMNFIAVVIVALLIGAGVWVADTIAGLDRDQDCAQPGSANCAPIEAPALGRG